MAGYKSFERLTKDEPDMRSPAHAAPRPDRRSVLIGGGAALGALPLLSRRAHAAEWPARPVKAEAEKWGKVAKFAGIKPE
jgi:hypothetical protein